MPESGTKRERAESTYDGSPEFGTFRRTLRFLFSVAVERALPKSRVVGGNPVGNGYWYLINDEDSVAQADVEAIEVQMRKMVENDIAITSVSVAQQDAVAYLEAASQPVAAKLLAKRAPLGGMATMHEVEVEGTRHRRLKFFPLLSSAGKLTPIRPWGLQRYKGGGGLVLFFGDAHDDQEAMQSAVRELRDWNKRAGVRSAADLSDQIEKDSKRALYVHAAEARLEAKITEAAHAIAARNMQARLRVVCIAGPTASGKTTFSHKLSLALRALGVVAKPLTVDHYYLPLDEQPKFKVACPAPSPLPPALLCGGASVPVQFPSSAWLRAMLGAWPGTVGASLSLRSI